MDFGFAFTVPLIPLGFGCLLNVCCSTLFPVWGNFVSIIVAIAVGYGAKKAIGLWENSSIEDKKDDDFPKEWETIKPGMVGVMTGCWITLMLALPAIVKTVMVIV